MYVYTVYSGRKHTHHVPLPRGVLLRERAVLSRERHTLVKKKKKVGFRKRTLGKALVTQKNKQKHDGDQRHTLRKTINGWV